MKKKAVAVVMTAVMALGMVSAVSVQAGIEDKTLIVGFDAEYPPYGYMDENGEYTGFDLELAQAVCDLEGWELEKKPINWDSKDMELNSGSIDCIWNGFTMNGREDDYTFSEPYVDNSQVIVVADDSGIEKLTDLAGKTVGVQAASAALDLLQSEEEGGQKELADTFGVRYLFSDFKKKEGYKKSTEISKEYHMYRQYYCGCVYSKRDRDREIVLRRQQEEQIL